MLRHVLADSKNAKSSAYGIEKLKSTYEIYSRIFHNVSSWYDYHMFYGV